MKKTILILIFIGLVSFIWYLNTISFRRGQASAIAHIDNIVFFDETLTKGETNIVDQSIALYYRQIYEGNYENAFSYLNVDVRKNSNLPDYIKEYRRAKIRYIHVPEKFIESEVLVPKIESARFVIGVSYTVGSDDQLLSANSFYDLWVLENGVVSVFPKYYLDRKKKNIKLSLKDKLINLKQPQGSDAKSKDF